MLSNHDLSMSQALVGRKDELIDVINHIDWSQLHALAQQASNTSCATTDTDRTRKTNYPVEDQINQIEKNYDRAMNLIPESFTPITMLYVDVVIKGLHFKAFVDTGAQISILSEFIAGACGLKDLIDTRYQGVARGVGEAKIIGRIHCVDLELGTQLIPCSFRVLQSQNIKLILGLDMLLSHGVTLDLQNKQLLIAGETIEFVSPDE